MSAIVRWVLGASALVASAAPVAAEWHEAKSRHFLIYGDMRPRELEEYATKLEKFDRAVRIARSMEDPPLGEGGRLTIYVLKDALAVATMAGNPKSNIAGFYTPRASGSIAFVHRDRLNMSPQLKVYMKTLPASLQWTPTDPEVVFFHEYFHHLMLSSANAALPKWIVEGFAEYYSTAAFERDGSVIIGRPAAHCSTSLFGKNRISLNELLSGPTRTHNPEETAEFYGRGWLLTHYLSVQDARRGQLQRYLAAVQQGRSSLDAARAAFGDLRTLDTELSTYLNSNDMGAYRVPAERLAIGTISTRALRTGEAEMIPVRMQSDRGVSEKTAAAIAAQARAIGAKYPGDAFVQGALAEAEYDAGNFQAASDAADRALAADPKNFQAMIYKGRALTGKAEKSDKPDMALARSWFVKANNLDPESAEPLMLYYRSFRAARTNPPEAAVDGLLYALDLAPQDSGLRMDAVSEMLTRGKADDARSLFAPIAFNPHSSPEWRERNSKIMDLIVASKTMEALTLMQAPAPKPATAPAQTKAN